MALALPLSDGIPTCPTTGSDLFSPESTQIGTLTKFNSTRLGPRCRPQGRLPRRRAAGDPGDGSSSDLTALFATRGAGQAGQIAYGDWCISANGVVPGTATQVPYITECSDDTALLWTFNASPATILNADGNCLTLRKAANGAPVTLSACTGELQHLQLWNAQVVST